MARAFANAHDGETIHFDCDTSIVLTHTLVIDRSVTLDSNRQIVLDGDHAVSIFQVNEGVSAALNHLTIRNGRDRARSGGINNDGTLTLVDSVLTGNDHAISNFGNLTVIRTSFVNNVGVGIYNQGQITVVDSTFTGNTHGIDNASGTATVMRSTFSKNEFVHPAGMGAGIANSGQVTVIDTKFIDNHAAIGGGIGSHKGGKVTLYNTLVLGSRVADTCFGPIIDGGGNLQYPGTACGARISSLDPRLLPAEEPNR